MLILPYQTKFTARSLPLATLALIVVNIFCFYLQSGDPKRYETLAHNYLDGDLATLELPRYRTWLAARSDPAARNLRREIDQVSEPVRPLATFRALQNDSAFLHELRAGNVIRSDEGSYESWRDERTRFDAAWSHIFTERFELMPGTGQPWRLITYQFLHGGLGHLIGNMLVLLVAGAFAEAGFGRARFLFAYLVSGAVAGGTHLVLSTSGLVGASGAIAATVAMVAVLYGTRRVPVFYWVFVYFDTAKMPALMLLPIWLASEYLQWRFATGETNVAYWVHIGGLVAGALIALALKPGDPRRIERVLDAEFGDEQRANRHSSLLRQAQEAAARLDTRRAARLYRELVEQNPENLEYLIAYFNIAMVSPDQDMFADASLRVLWARSNNAAEELRRIYLQMSQTRVLQILPVDEQLRLARRLVRSREHNAALDVLDRLLIDDNLRTLYARQIADCLLGLFTTYARYGLKRQADSVRTRLARYFPAPGSLGGLAPKTTPPRTIRGSTAQGAHGPDTIYIDLGR